MSIAKDICAIDVVIDVPTARVDTPFTYAVKGELPPLGSRVRVPLGGRSVEGWVVSEPVSLPADAALKFVERIEAGGPHFTPAAVRFAAWLRHRYACTFREALSAISSRATAHAAQTRFVFTSGPQEVENLGALLFGRFGEAAFTAVAARRELRSNGIRMPLSALQKELARLVRAGIVARIAAPRRKAVPPAPRPQSVALLDPAAARGAAQKRLAEALSQAGGTLMLSAAKARAAVTPAIVRRAAAAGAIRIDEVAPSGAAVTGWLEDRQAPVPSDEQRAVIDRTDEAMRSGPVVALLHGITGSGKTYVYSQLVGRLRDRGGRAILLVPEISLTPQTAARFAALFGSRVGILHSGLSDGERARVWADAAEGALDVVVGARSAVFAPLPDLRLIILDEEHEPSYKQDVAPRYDAATVARKRMDDAGGAVLLGSATPSLESYWEATSGSMLYLRMERRATLAPLPPVEVVEMARERAASHARPLSPALVTAMERALRAGEKVMLFVNRRGYAGLLLCRACGFAPRCRRCAISLVVHSADRSMRCHICGAAYRMPARCPKCKSDDIKPFGFGTQRIELEVRDLFPSARVVRMDADTTGTRGAHATLLRAFGEEADVLIGTQMIAKGLDFPTLTVVGVVAADLDLNRPDFRAAERTFQLLAQVAGRAGRATSGSQVIVQAYAAEHYAVAFAAQHDYEGFARKELGLRRELSYPPFGTLAYLGIGGSDGALAAQKARALAVELGSSARDVDVLGPAPDPRPKARGEYRFRIALKAPKLDMLLEACAQAQQFKLGRDVRLTVTVDPR